MTQELAQKLGDALGVKVARLTRVSGGDINDAYAAELSDGAKVFVKTRADAPRGMYKREAEGLAFLAEAHAIRVPEVLFASDQLLVLEYIERGRERADYDVQLGRGLGALHKFGAPFFGHIHDNFIGNLPQENALTSSWSEFYGQRRLAPMMARAERQGTLPAALRRDLEHVIERLAALLGDAEPPARLHGDLWTGNVYVDDHGAPVLIDPAAYGGHREVDLAMLNLFGSPSADFYAAYDEVYPRAPGFRQREPVYQLYPLLVHVCLFGASYLSPLARTVREVL
jgi:fructosamine-3-kinase